MARFIPAWPLFGMDVEPVATVLFALSFAAMRLNKHLGHLFWFIPALYCFVMLPLGHFSNYEIHGFPPKIPAVAGHLVVWSAS